MGPQQEAPQPVSSRAAGVLEEIATAMGRVGEAYRPSALRRNIMTFQFQRWHSILGAKLREQLVA